MAEKVGRAVKPTQETWIQVRMSATLKEKLEAWAADEEESMSSIIRRLIRDGVAAHEGTQES